MRSFCLFFQPHRGPRSSFPVPSLHSEGSRALTEAQRVQSVHLVRPQTGGLGKLHKPEPRLQGSDKETSPRLANHGAGNSPSGPPISFVMRPHVSPSQQIKQWQSWEWFWSDKMGRSGHAGSASHSVLNPLVSHNLSWQITEDTCRINASFSQQNSFYQLFQCNILPHCSSLTLKHTFNNSVQTLDQLHSRRLRPGPDRATDHRCFFSHAHWTEKKNTFENKA